MPKISELPAAATLTGTEELPLVQSGVTKKATTTQFSTAILSSLFLTPQQFNAVGDGLTDDTAAITDAVIASASTKLPLMFVGGYTYAVDSVPLVSNAVLVGDKNTTIKLKDSATGSIFVWPPNATTSNVTFSGLVLDGNFSGQSGAPHNLIHGIFLSADDTSIVSKAIFENLYIHDVDGSVWFVSVNAAITTIYNDCIFRDIYIYHFTQTSFSCQANRCLFENYYADNATNSNVPFSGQGNAYGISAKATYSTFRNIRIALSTTAQTLAGGGTIGIAIIAPSATQGNNVLEDCDVDSGSCVSNFGYSIDTGKGNKCSNLTARNGAFNCDYEFLTQTDLQANNLYSENSLGSNVGIVWRDITNATLNGYTFRGNTQNEEAMFMQGTINGLTISNYDIDTAYSAIRLATGSYVKLLGGVVKNCVNAFDSQAGATATDWLIDGLDFDGGTAPGSFPWEINDLTRVTIANFDARNMSSKEYVQNNCVDMRFDGIRGVDFTRQSIGVGSVRASCGTFDGGRVCVYYNFATHGGTVGTKNLGVTLPKGAIVTRVYTISSVTFTSGTSTAQIAIGVADTHEAFVAATLVTNGRFVAGNPAFGIMDGTVLANYFYNDAEQQITFTITVENLTAGMIQIVVDYDMNAF